MRENKTLKVISYILLPILIAIIIISVMYTVAKESYNNELNISYFETDEFSENYMTWISYQARNLIYRTGTPNIQDGGTRIFYDNVKGRLKDSYFLIVYKDKALTNVRITDETKTIEDIKRYMDEQKGEKVVFVNGETKSNIGYNEYYGYLFQFNYYNNNGKDYIIQSIDDIEYEEYSESIGTETVYEKTEFKDFEIYTTYQK